MQTINRFLYGPTAEEKVRAWQAKLRSEQRTLDREMRQVRDNNSWHVIVAHLSAVWQLDAATKKAQQTVKQLAKKGDTKSARIIAREVVRSHKQMDRLSVSKARLGSIGNQLQQQLGAHVSAPLSSISSYEPCHIAAMAKVTGSLQRSTEIMKLSNSLVKLPQISQTMREMSMEMTKVSGIRTS